MKELLTSQDVTITRHSVDGFTLSALVDGHLAHRRYIGYTVPTAMNMFLVEFGTRCECSDPGCPACLGSCEMAAEYWLRRTDMDDTGQGIPMCEQCAADALESGVFAVIEDEDEDEEEIYENQSD